jgi:uncharacterized protein YjbI with pentapeptide repeats
MATTLYDLLEVSKTASPEVIKSAYRSIATKLHPDSGSTPDEEKFKTVAKAYDVLSDTVRRAEYDARLHHEEESVFLGLKDAEQPNASETVKRTDGSDTWCTIEEHLRRKGAELSGADLKGLTLKNIPLDHAKMDGADLSHAAIENVSFVGADLSAVTAKHAVFLNVDFSKANLNNAKISQCVFKDCEFSESQVEDASLLASDFRGSSFATVKFANVDFSDSIFEGVEFSSAAQNQYEPVKHRLAFDRCLFPRTNLRRVSFGKKGDRTLLGFKEADFTGANLTEANCNNSAFIECCFSDASLAETEFKKAHVKNPQTFEGASLNGADFTGATLENMDISSCNVVNARFHQTIRTNVTFPPGFIAPESVTESLEKSANVVLPDATGRVIIIVFVIIIAVVLLVAIST